MGKGKKKALDEIVRSNAQKLRRISRLLSGNASNNLGCGSARYAPSRSRPSTSHPPREIRGPGPSARWLLAAGNQAIPEED